MKPKISIIIPAYNEEKRIGLYLDEIKKYVSKNKLNAEIIVVDDGSKDKTTAIARKYTRKVYTNKPNRGKGYSVKRGMLLARGDYLLFTDADGATPIKEMKKFIQILDGKKYDIVIGSRSIKGAKLKKKQPFYRLVLGKGFFVLTWVLIGLNFHDTQCGFKIFTKKAARTIFPKQTIERWGFDPELLFLAKRKGFKVKEEPVEWHDKAGSKVSPVKDAIKMLCELIKVRWNSWTGKY